MDCVCVCVQLAYGMWLSLGSNFFSLYKINDTCNKVKNLLLRHSRLLRSLNQLPCHVQVVKGHRIVSMLSISLISAEF